MTTTTVTRIEIATTTGTDGTTTVTVAAVDATSALPPGESAFSGAGLAPRSAVKMRGAETAEKTAGTTVAAMGVVAAMRPPTRAPSTASWSSASRTAPSSQPLVGAAVAALLTSRRALGALEGLLARSAKTPVAARPLPRRERPRVM